MTLLITVFAAVISTVSWYKNAPDDELKRGVLCWLFWGASLMWLVDAVFEYAELGAAYFTPEPQEMLNDIFLGISAVALALVIWLVILLLKDPRRVIPAVLHRSQDK